MARKLTANTIKREQKNIEDWKKHTVEVHGEDYEFEINHNLKKTVIEDFGLRMRALAIQLYTDEKYEDLSEAGLDSVSQLYTGIAIIGATTNIDVPLDVEEALQFASALYDLDILSEILGSIPVEQVERLDDEAVKSLSEFTEEMNEKIAEAQALQDKIDKEYSEVLEEDGGDKTSTTKKESE